MKDKTINETTKGKIQKYSNESILQTDIILKPQVTLKLKKTP